MHRRASNRCAAVIAPVGQAVMQRSHVPQRSGTGSSGGNSSVVKISARKNQVPSRLIDKHGAFAVPANASLRGMIPFQHRPGVDITFLLSAKAAKKLVDPVQLCPDYIVIVVAPGVPRDPSCSSCSRAPCGRRVSLKIIQRQDNNRSRAGQNALRIATFFLAALHVIHFAVRAVAQPFTKVICMRRRVARGYATRIKPDLSRKRDKPRLQFCCRNLRS